MPLIVIRSADITIFHPRRAVSPTTGGNNHEPERDKQPAAKAYPARSSEPRTTRPYQDKCRSDPETQRSNREYQPVKRDAGNEKQQGEWTDQQRPGKSEGTEQT